MARTILDNQILDAALDMIIQRGYAGATTREIALAAGINEVTLFRRFGSKEKLMQAVVEQEARLFMTAGIAYTGELEADLLRIVTFYRDLMQTRGRAILAIINELPRQPELMAIMHTPLGIFTIITELIERYQNEGKLLKETPFHAFMALVGPLFLASALGFVQPPLSDTPLDPAEQVRRYLQGRMAAGTVEHQPS